MPPAAGGASPPGPPDRQGAGAGCGFEFLLRKNYKTGVSIYQFICSIGGIRPRVLPGRKTRLSSKWQAFPDDSSLVGGGQSTLPPPQRLP